MANLSKRQRRLWDTYTFPGFRPQPTVRGVFGDPKARLIMLARRVRCRSCGKVKRERLDFLADNPLYTKRFTIRATPFLRRTKRCCVH